MTDLMKPHPTQRNLDKACDILADAVNREVKARGNDIYLRYEQTERLRRLLDQLCALAAEAEAA